jgi:hypothetical protein
MLFVLSTTPTNFKKKISQSIWKCLREDEGKYPPKSVSMKIFCFHVAAPRLLSPKKNPIRPSDLVESYKFR